MNDSHDMPSESSNMPERPSPAFRNKRKRLVLGECWTDESAAETGGFSSFGSSGEEEGDEDTDMASVTQEEGTAEPASQRQLTNASEGNLILPDSLMRSPSIIHEVSSSSEDESEDFASSSRSKTRSSSSSRRSSHKRASEDHNDYTLQYPAAQAQPQLRRRNSKKLIRRKSNENLNTSPMTSPTNVPVLVPFPSSSKRRSRSSSSLVTPTKTFSAVQQLPIQPPLKLRIYQKTRVLKSALKHFSKSHDKKKMIQDKITEGMETIKSEGDAQWEIMKLRWAPDAMDFQSACHESSSSLGSTQSSGQPQKPSRIIILSSNHPLKITWDFLTVVLTFLSAYYTHTSIRDRSTYEWNTFSIFSYAWFLTDILLNFITSHVQSDGKVLRSGKDVWSRYLTTWFVVDALSLLPWERMFVRPIIKMQNRRNWVTKWFFRSKAVVKVSRILRGKHFRAFGRIAKETKHYGVGGQRLLRLIIKYVPKYILFYRNMKGVLVLKVLRQIHFARKIRRGLSSAAPMSEYYAEDQNSSDVNSIDISVTSTENDKYLEDENAEEDDQDRETSEGDLALGYFGGDDCEISSAGVVNHSDGDDSLSGESYVSREDLKSPQSDFWLPSDESWFT